MPNDNTPIVDPDGQPLMNGLSDLGMAPEDAYNVVQGVREMSGQKVIAEFRAQGAESRAQEAETRAFVAETHAETAALVAETHAETRALVAETHAEIAALVAETHAETRALVAETHAEIAALASRVDANTARLDTMGWTVTATLALVVALAAAGLLNWITGRWDNQRSMRNQSSGEESTA